MLKRDLIVAAACALAFLPAVSAFADDDISKKLLNAPNAEGWAPLGPTQTSTKIKDSTVQGGSAVQINIAGATPHPWDDSANFAVSDKITNGDKLIIVVWMKASGTDNGAPGQANIRMQVNSAPYDALGEKRVTITSDWQMYTLDTTAAQDYAKGSTNVSVHLGYAKQTISLGPCFVIDMNKK